MPKEYNLEDVCHKITNGNGFVQLEGMFSNKDVEMAKERIFNHNCCEVNMCVNQDGKQNNYSGLTWGLLSRGRVFTKMATHPVILEVSKKLLGDGCRLSSLSANTVVPGMEGQNPHLDYPYHRNLWPAKEGSMNLPPTHPLSLVIVTLITDFTPENGSTAIVPGSHIDPHFPDDSVEFFKKAKQITAKAGDVVIIAGNVQHCAMPNKANMIRSAILQQMVPLFVTPFERICVNGLEEVNEDLRKMLAVDHPHPMVKFTQKEPELRKNGNSGN